LYKDNVAVGSELPGTGSPATFSGTFNTEGVYTARSVAAGAYVETKMAGERTVAVNPLPVATVAATTVCYNTQATLSATLGAGTTTQMTYTWNYNGMSGTGTSSSFPTSALTVTTTYTVQLRNANSCVGNVSPAATITVHPVFTSGSISTAGQTLCAGATLTPITGGIIASGGYGAATYQWTYSNGASTVTLSTNSATLEPPAALTNSPGTYTFKRWAKDAMCNTAWTASSGEWQILVSAYPSISTSPQSRTLCGYNVFLTLTVEASAGSGNISNYQWKRNNVDVGTGNPYTAVVSEGGTYTVVVTNSHGCSATSNSATVTVGGQETGKIGTTVAGCSTDAKPGAIGVTVAGCSVDANPGVIGF
jgi:hypothetical protein